MKYRLSTLIILLIAFLSLLGMFLSFQVEDDTIAIILTLYGMSSFFIATVLGLVLADIRYRWSGFDEEIEEDDWFEDNQDVIEFSEDESELDFVLSEDEESEVDQRLTRYMPPHVRERRDNEYLSNPQFDENPPSDVLDDTPWDEMGSDLGGV